MKQLTIDNLRKASNAITGERRLRVNEKKHSELIRRNAVIRQAQLDSGINLIREADDNERW